MDEDEDTNKLDKQAEQEEDEEDEEGAGDYVRNGCKKQLRRFACLPDRRGALIGRLVGACNCL